VNSNCDLSLPVTTMAMHLSSSQPSGQPSILDDSTDDLYGFAFDGANRFFQKLLLKPVARNSDYEGYQWYDELASHGNVALTIDGTTITTGRPRMVSRVSVFTDGTKSGRPKPSKIPRSNPRVVELKIQDDVCTNAGSVLRTDRQSPHILRW
jgi:hypothetical protein